MDLGLYPLKYPFRKMISFVLPLVKDVSPDAVSWTLIPLGAATAAVYYCAASGGPAYLYLVGIVLLFVRMFIGTLDGLMATHFQKETPLGAAVNRLAPEMCDVMYMCAIAAARPEWAPLGIAAVGLCWVSSYAGIVGGAGGLPVEAVGPLGQTDRVASLELASLLAFLALRFGWGVDVMTVFLWWVVIGSVPTFGIRLYRLYRNAARAAA